MNSAFVQHDPNNLAPAASVNALTVRTYDAPKLIVLGKAAAITQGSGRDDTDTSGIGRRR